MVSTRTENHHLSQERISLLREIAEVDIYAHGFKSLGQQQLPLKDERKPVLQLLPTEYHKFRMNPTTLHGKVQKANVPAAAGPEPIRLSLNQGRES